ncbi:MAG TPA: AgmX/PglI C-terminal domain-containing protein [Nevskiaceae bacterium]|nr:AgmX/PglI C-terminal domain-containing protein [Nevskiaceae bacterium]
MNATLMLGPDQGWGLAEASDRRFRRLAALLIVLYLVFAVIVPFLKLQGLERGGGETTERRYISLIPDAEVADQVEEPKPAEQAEEPEQVEEPKPVQTPDEQPSKPAEQVRPEPTREQQVQAARQQAAQTGVLALADQLKALRDNSLSGFDASRALSSEIVTAQPGTGATGGSAGAANLAQTAAASSGGISGAGTGEQRRSQSGAGLGSRRTTTVDSPVGIGPDKTRPGQDGDKPLAGRTLEEIQQVMDRNKSALYSLYNRALRDNPSLRGTMSVSLTIAADGSVLRCEIVSSELGDPDLERKVLARIQLINFGAKSVPEFTLPSYPIHFYAQ